MQQEHTASAVIATSNRLHIYFQQYWYEYILYYVHPGSSELNDVKALMYCQTIHQCYL